MSDKNMWLKAGYYDQFRCKCGECRNCCCGGWNIAVSMEEYFRLIGMDCSELLHRRLETAFREPEFISPEHYRVISPNWTGVCPMLDEDGLCMLQKECGEDMLPEVCRLYPRSQKKAENLYRACCSNSCEKVVEMLMDAERMELMYHEDTLKTEISENENPDVNELNLIYMHMIQDRSIPLEKRIARICGEKDCEHRKIALEKVMLILDVLRNDFDSINMYAADALTRYTGEDALKNCCDDVDFFEKKYPDWEIYFENILANHLMYMNYPYVDRRLDAKDARIGLQAAYAIMRTVCAAYTRDKEGPEPLADVIADIFRLIEHSAFYYNIRVLTKGNPENA